MKKPKIVYHPGILLRDEMEARAKKCKCCGHIKPYTAKELAKKSGITQSQISFILKGHRNITPLMSRRLAKAFKCSPAFWMNLQVAYDVWLLDKYDDESRLKTKK